MAISVAALYDIHGNLPALERVIDEVRELGVEEIVIGGDVIPGPMPRETLAYVRALDLPIHFIHGNGELAVLEERAGRNSGVPAQFRGACAGARSSLQMRNLVSLLAGRRRFPGRSTG
jgi:hypothetical protein